jgi:hypothetical protein
MRVYTEYMPSKLAVFMAEDATKTKPQAEQIQERLTEVNQEAWSDELAPHQDIAAPYL